MAVVLAQSLRFPILPAAPFLLYEPSDVPLLLTGFLLGPGWAAGVAVCVAVTMSAGGGGLIGAVSRLAGSAALGVTAAVVYRLLPERTYRVWLATATGVVAYVGIEVLITLALGPVFMGLTRELAVQMLLPVVLPFNLLKGSINGLVGIGVYRLLGGVRVQDRLLR